MAVQCPVFVKRVCCVVLAAATHAAVTHVALVTLCDGMVVVVAQPNLIFWLLAARLTGAGVLMCDDRTAQSCSLWCGMNQSGRTKLEPHWLVMCERPRLMVRGSTQSTGAGSSAG